MSIIRTIDHSEILNFIPATETSGTTVTSEAGSVITDASLAFATEYAIELQTSVTNQALTSGSWQEPTAGADWALMILINFDDGVAAQLRIGHTTTNHCIQMVGGNNIVLRGAGGLLSMTGEAPALNTASRLLITYDADGHVRTGKSALGSDLSYSSNTYDTDCGDITILNDVYTASNFGGDIKLYGMQMVQFVNGLPTDIVDKANALFDLWEAGNKTHFPLLEDTQ